MKYLRLPADDTRILPFYLAMEEWAAHIIGDEDIFFMWQVAPTVIFGRNQLIANEVNLAYCHEHGIATYRRKSGGGCVFADRSNIMFSYITRGDDVTHTFERYTQAVAAMLRGLGLNATAGGRNDVLIDGRKVSGNAFYHLPGRSIVHGTMLYDTDMAHMAQAITPSTAKLQSKGVESVRQHITTLHEHLPDLDIEDFKRYVRDTLCDGEIVLTKEDVYHIEQITRTYLTSEFIYGNNPRCNVTRHERIEGVGELDVRVEVNRNVIKELNIAGDFFLLADIDTLIIDRLRGCQYDRENMTHALAGLDVSRVIMNLTNEQLINLLIQ